MTQLTARVTFEDKEHNQAVVLVHTSKCFYSVVIRNSEATVVGPGIEETYNIGDPIPDNLSYKGIAIVAVTLLEEGD